MMDRGRRRGGGVCPSCKRSFDQGVRFCPHDASELTPIAVYTATSRATRSAPTGIIAKICPQCRRRYDLSASFCARDSTELVVLN
jgi:predicted amidophosphoribosyltransferase